MRYGSNTRITDAAKSEKPDDSLDEKAVIVSPATKITAADFSFYQRPFTSYNNTLFCLFEEYRSGKIKLIQIQAILVAFHNAIENYRRHTADDTRQPSSDAILTYFRALPLPKEMDNGNTDIEQKVCGPKKPSLLAPLSTLKTVQEVANLLETILVPFSAIDLNTDLLTQALTPLITTIDDLYAFRMVCERIDVTSDFNKKYRIKEKFEYCYHCACGMVAKKLLGEGASEQDIQEKQTEIDRQMKRLYSYRGEIERTFKALRKDDEALEATLSAKKIISNDDKLSIKYKSVKAALDTLDIKDTSEVNGTFLRLRAIQKHTKKVEGYLKDREHTECHRDPTWLRWLINGLSRVIHNIPAEIRALVSLVRFGTLNYALPYTCLMFSKLNRTAKKASNLANEMDQISPAPTCGQR